MIVIDQCPMCLKLHRDLFYLNSDYCTEMYSKCLSAGELVNNLSTESRSDDVYAEDESTMSGDWRLCPYDRLIKCIMGEASLLVMSL